MIQFDRVKKLAKKKKLTLREVNDMAGIGTNSIYNWKSRKPGSDAVKAVANVLNTTTDYLNGVVDDPAPPINSENNNSIPLDENSFYTYRGYNIPEKYLNMIRGLMEEDIKEGQVKRDGDSRSK